MTGLTSGIDISQHLLHIARFEVVDFDDSGGGLGEVATERFGEPLRLAANNDAVDFPSLPAALDNSVRESVVAESTVLH